MNNFRWKKGKMIGQGAYGLVYEGLNLETGELMAVKQVEITKASQEVRIKIII